jgi:hypothetical protein
VEEARRLLRHRARQYRDLFNNYPESADVLADLQARFGGVLVTTQNHTSSTSIVARAAQFDVLNYVLMQIARADEAD